MEQVDRSPSSLVLRAWLAKRLVDYRKNAELSQAEVSEAIDWSVSKIQRIEAEIVSVSATDVKALLDVYGVASPDVVTRLVEVAKVARKRDRFSAYRKYFSHEYNVLLSYEEAASVIRSVNSFALPGLLQTSSYAKSLLAVRHSGEKFDKLAAARTLRQEILVAPDAPEFVFLIDEAMLRRQVGGRGVLMEQLAHLSRMSVRENVELRVIPFAADVHLGLWEQFVIMTIPASDLTGESSEMIVYREAGDSEHLIRHDEDRVASYEKAFAEVYRQTLNPADSRSLIDELVRELSASLSEAADTAPR
ncbi:helix-turn-helix domain-containing protein [Actinophytocola glycyrrhizae]|uniref:Helix-turn-helix domain-containing protein n=1 Tax=Actinophytocola glycyrrhizae TaxID=2044873 RepID=A0ABV9SE43_9PSEU